MSEPELSIWEKALGWRKRQMIQSQLDPISNKIRNDALEEVAKEFDKMVGDTSASFAVYVRSMKKVNND
jgi:CRISPR/Cas system CMR subunit Cmr6 (Cas7 group RAMP superfamily)